MEETCESKWKETLVNRALARINFRSNRREADSDNIKVLLSDFLEDGILILKDWRKLKNDDEFLSHKHDPALVRFIIDRYQMNGREAYDEYTEGMEKAVAKISPEARLRSSCSQRI